MKHIIIAALMLLSFSAFSQGGKIWPKRDVEPVKSTNSIPAAGSDKSGYIMLSDSNGVWLYHHMEGVLDSVLLYADSMDISNSLGSQQKIRILSGSTPLDSVYFTPHFPTTITAVYIDGDSLCVEFSYLLEGSLAFETLCADNAVPSDSSDYAFNILGTSAPVTSPADSAERSGYTKYSGKIESKTKNLNNYYWHTQTSEYNPNPSGYMGTQRMLLDSLSAGAIGTQYGPFGQWIETFSWDTTINGAFDNGGNLLYDRGWNYDSGSALYNPLRPKYKFSTELGYYPGNGNTLWIEEHPEVTDTTGRNVRPYDWYVAYDGSSAGFSVTSDRTYIYRSPEDALGPGDAWELHDFQSGIHDIYHQDYHLRINEDYSGSIISKYWTPGNSFRNVLAHLTNNMLHVGDSSGVQINNTLFFSQASGIQSIKSSTDALLIDSCLVTLLNPGDGNFRNLLFAQPGDADRFVMGYGGQALTFGKLNGSEAIFRIDQGADNYSMHIASDGKIRINMNSGFGGIDFTQFSNDAAGGFMQRNTAGSSWVAQYLNGSGDWTFNFTNTERFKLKSDGVFHAAEYDDTPPTGEPAGIIVHESDGDFKSMGIGEGLIYDNGELTLLSGGSDSLIYQSDTLCFIVMGDTTCVELDSIFYLDDEVCFIEAGDTTCIDYSSSGGNIYNTSGTLTMDRVMEILGFDFTIKENGAERFKINAPFGTNKLAVTSGNPTLVPALTLQNYTSGNHLFLHYDGLFAGFRDYSTGVIPGESAFVMSDSSNLHSPFLKHYAALNRTDLLHQTKFADKLLDKDGDAGTSGQVLVSTGSQVNWVDQSSGNGIYDSANEGDTAEVSSILIDPISGLYLQHMSSVSDYWGYNPNVGQIIHNSTKSGDILELANSHATAGTWIKMSGAGETYRFGINRTNADWELQSGSTEVFTIENDPTVDNTLQLQADGDVRIADYPNSRDDGAPTNVLGTDANGVIQSYPVADVGGGAGDDWGSDVVNTDATLTGDGTSGNPLKVDTTVIATKASLPGGIVSVTFPAQSLTNSTSSDQDFTSVYQIPAGKIVAGKVYEVVLTFDAIAGTSNALWSAYIKLGSTKVMTQNAGVNLGNGSNFQVTVSFYIIGNAAPSGSSLVHVSNGSYMFLFGAVDVTDPTTHDTSVNLDIVPGINFNLTGSTETFTLQSSIIKELN